MPTQTLSPRERQTRENLIGALSLAVNHEPNSESETCQQIINTLVDSGVSVMVHGRPPNVAEEAGTQRWVVEMECFPICVIEEWGGDQWEAIQQACLRFLKALNRRFPNQRLGER